MADSIARRLEQYTIARSHEVLIAFDPEVPVLPEGANILSVDRLQSPYNPNNPRYLQQGLSWETMQSLLSEAGV